jgi:8-oxo-dGTP pyrophosphatase MutT (NUDIX family)
MEFLLVRTSDGKRWTFPKGHVEDSESPAEAAAREAFEEAGVTGTIDLQPVAEYFYPGRRAPHGVTAFLMAVTDERPPQEGHREPTWFDVTAAKNKLAEHREEQFVQEHERVLNAAAARLTGAEDG